ncbi:PD40 domain-containing protein [Lutibacter sp. B2]|nr:PD40 domain-containing protein [Lutibacter sp. B2]
MYFKRMILSCIFICISFSIMGCSDLKKEEKIVVLDEEEYKMEENIIAKIEKYEDVIFMDWMNENEIIIAKENKDIHLVDEYNEEYSPLNIYSHDLKTKEEKIINAQSYNEEMAILSPDKNHIFYKRSDEYLYTGFIYDMKNNKNIQITKENDLVYREGYWLNNKELLLTTEDGKVSIVNTEGKKSLLLDVKDRVYDVIKIENKLYYTTKYGELYMYHLDTRQKQLMMKDVGSVVLSPDSENLAIVKHVEDSDEEIMITDLKGNIISSLSKGNQISGVSWSPDGRKVAYAVNVNGNINGIYSTDLKTQKINFVTGDFSYIGQQPIKWSSSGEKIIVATQDYNYDIKKLVYTSYLIIFK